MKMVPAFEHRPGVHCISTAIGNILHHRRLTLSEPMIIGLGSGLGFVFMQFKGLPHPFFGGSVRDLVGSFCARMGAKLTRHESSSPDRAWKAVKALVDAGQPVICQTNLAALDYGRGTPDFGGHLVVLAGYDSEAVYLADTNRPWPSRCSLGAFAAARSFKDGMYNVKHAYLTMDLPKAWPPLGDLIAAAIRETVPALLSPPVQFLGLPGMEKMARNLDQFPDIGVIHLWSEEAGTGGGMFRKLYAAFLDEAQQHLSHPSLAPAAALYREAGEAWTRTAQLARDTGDRKAVAAGIRAAEAIERKALMRLAEV